MAMERNFRIVPMNSKCIRVIEKFIHGDDVSSNESHDPYIEDSYRKQIMVIF